MGSPTLRPCKSGTKGQKIEVCHPAYYDYSPDRLRYSGHIVAHVNRALVYVNCEFCFNILTESERQTVSKFLRTARRPLIYVSLELVRYSSR